MSRTLSPGVTNKLLAKDVDLVLAASADAVEKLGAPDKTFVVGNPVRPEVLSADREGGPQQAEGGGPHGDPQFWWQSGG